MNCCKKCKHFDTACAGTSQQTDYCKKTGEIVKDVEKLRDCFEKGRKTYNKRLREAMLYAKKRRHPRQWEAAQGHEVQI